MTRYRKCSKNHLQQTRISKILRGTNPRTPATGSALEHTEQGRQLSNAGPARVISTLIQTVITRLSECFIMCRPSGWTLKSNSLADFTRFCCVLLFISDTWSSYCNILTARMAYQLYVLLFVRRCHTLGMQAFGQYVMPTVTDAPAFQRLRCPIDLSDRPPDRSRPRDQ